MQSLKHFYSKKYSESKSFTEKMREKIDSKEGREIYSGRMGIIEPVFCEHSISEAIKLFYPANEAKSKYSVEFIFINSQYRKDSKIYLE